VTKTNRIEYKQELTDRLEKEVIAFLNYHEGGIITGLVDRLVEGLADSQKKIIT